MEIGNQCKRLAFLGVIAINFCLILNTLSYAESVRIIDLSPQGGIESNAIAINSRGQVAGSYRTETGVGGFLWDNDQIVVLQGVGTRVEGLSDSGEVIGCSLFAETQIRPTIWSPITGAETFLGSNSGCASASNSSGSIVGYYYPSLTSPEGFLLRNGEQVPLGTLGGAHSTARAINSFGQIVGSSATNGFASHVFLWENGTMRSLGTLPFSTHSFASGINDRGEVVGWASSFSGPGKALFYEPTNGMKSLGTFGGIESRALGINNSGAVVGYAATNTGAHRAFIWEGGELIDLNSLISAELGIELLQAKGINDSGQIVGSARVNGKKMAFIMGDNKLPQLPDSFTASQGSSLTAVDLSWSVVSGAENYQIFRSEFADEKGALLHETELTSSMDTSAVPGKKYYYTIEVVNQYGASESSPSVMGWRGVVPVQDPEDLGDPNPDDTSCNLKDYTRFTKYNTLLGPQENLLQLAVDDPAGGVIEFSVFGPNGELYHDGIVSLAEGQSETLDITALVGRKNTFGLIKLSSETDYQANFLARVQADPTEDTLAYRRSVRRSLQGKSNGIANSIHPTGLLGSPVLNWAEIVNTGSEDRTFLYRLYREDGQLAESGSILVPANGERDLAAGHQYGQGIYSFELEPTDGAAKYIASITRYYSSSSDNTASTNPSYVVSTDLNSGTDFYRLQPITSGLGNCSIPLSWLELANIRQIPITALITVYNASGESIRSLNFSIPPQQQAHFYIPALLEEDGSYIEVTSEIAGSLLLNNPSYFHHCKHYTLQGVTLAADLLRKDPKDAPTCKVSSPQ